MSAEPTFTGANTTTTLDPSWGLLALLHLAIVEDQPKALAPLWRALGRYGGPAWDALARRHSDGYRASDDVHQLVNLLHNREELSPLSGGWASRSAALHRWVLGDDDARAVELRTRLRLRGAWRLPCGHSVQELDAPGVCEGCTIAKLRGEGPA